MPSTITWTGGAPGDTRWSNPQNWAPAVVPGPNDTAVFSDLAPARSLVATVDVPTSVFGLIISQLWTGNIQVNQPLTVGDSTGILLPPNPQFVLAGGTLGGDGAINLFGTSIWSGGTLNVGAGGLENHGPFHMQGTFLLGDGTLKNDGILFQEHDLFLDGGFTIDNGGTYALGANLHLNEFHTGGGKLLNRGTFEENADNNGIALVTVDFIDSPSARTVAQSGELAFNTTNLVISGTLDPNTGSEIDLKGDPTVLSGAITGGTRLGVVKLVSDAVVDGLGAMLDFPTVGDDVSMFQWTSGTINTLGGILTNRGALSLTSGGPHALTGSGFLINETPPTFASPTPGKGNVGAPQARIFQDADLSLDAFLDNKTSASYTLFAGRTLSSVPGSALSAFSNEGLLTKRAGSASSTVTAVFNNLASGAIGVQSGVLQLVPAGGSFAAASRIDVFSPDGAVVWVPSAMFSVSGLIEGAGRVVISGTMHVGVAGLTLERSSAPVQWTSGTIDQRAGSLTNLSGLDLGSLVPILPLGLPPAPVRVIGGSLVNQGAIRLISPLALELDQGATLVNLARGSLAFLADAAITTDQQGSSITNLGLLTKTGGTGISRIDPLVDSTGTVDVHSGTLNLAGPVAQVAGNTLTAGTWSAVAPAGGAATLTIGPVGLSIPQPPSLFTINPGASVTLSGPGASFTNLTSPQTIAGTLALLNGNDLASATSILNSGSIVLGPGSQLSTPRTYAQPASGTLHIQIAGSPLLPTAGSINVQGRTGLVSLAGPLAVDLLTIPRSGSSLTIINNTNINPFGVPVAVQGTFAGLPEGATFAAGQVVFQITYRGGDGNDVVLKVLSSPAGPLAPAFANRTITSPILQGGIATLGGTIQRLSPRDGFALVVNWGDGTPTRLYHFPPGTPPQIQVTHRYNVPGVFPVRLIWFDQHLRFNTATLPVIVRRAGRN